MGNRQESRVHQYYPFASAVASTTTIPFKLIKCKQKFEYQNLGDKKQLATARPFPVQDKSSVCCQTVLVTATVHSFAV